MKNHHCPHGICWYHAETECWQCQLDVLKHEEEEKAKANALPKQVFIITPKKDEPKEPPTPVQVEVLDVYPGAEVPKQAYKRDAGHDLSTQITVQLKLFMQTIVPSGLAFNIPCGYYG